MEIKKIKPDYILLNYLRKQNEFYASGYAKAGIKLGLLDQEGGAFIDFEKFESLRLTKNLSLEKALIKYFFGMMKYMNMPKKWMVSQKLRKS